MSTNNIEKIQQAISERIFICNEQIRHSDPNSKETTLMMAARDEALAVKRLVAAHEEAIEASLSLLDSPVPGMRVEGEGYAWVYVPEGDEDAVWLNGDPNTDWVYAHCFMPTLKGLVRGGAKVVLPQEGE